MDPEILAAISAIMVTIGAGIRWLIGVVREETKSSRDALTEATNKHHETMESRHATMELRLERADKEGDENRKVFSAATDAFARGLDEIKKAS
jgi:hypothetical protein